LIVQRKPMLYQFRHF